MISANLRQEFALLVTSKNFRDRLMKLSGLTIWYSCVFIFKPILDGPGGGTGLGRQCNAVRGITINLDIQLSIDLDIEINSID